MPVSSWRRTTSPASPTLWSRNVITPASSAQTSLNEWGHLAHLAVCPSVSDSVICMTSCVQLCIMRDLLWLADWEEREHSSRNHSGHQHHTPLRVRLLPVQPCWNSGEHTDTHFFINTQLQIYILQIYTLHLLSTPLNNYIASSYIATQQQCNKTALLR